jgi:hypothetical protein
VRNTEAHTIQYQVDFHNVVEHLSSFKKVCFS